MGQVALGIRSLLVRLVVFVAMAALLAWALGGTLVPRAETAEYDAVSDGQQSWYWRLSVGGRRLPELDPLGVRWELMRRDARGTAAQLGTDGWVEVAGPVLGDGTPWFAGRERSDAPIWQLYRVDDETFTEVMQLGTRLEVELQLARLAAGGPPWPAEDVRERAADVTVDARSAAAGAVDGASGSDLQPGDAAASTSRPVEPQGDAAGRDGRAGARPAG